MKHFTKAICVVDTCSIINLDGIELAKHDILYYVRCFFDVRVCTAVREEFERHRNLVSSQEASYWGRFLGSRRYIPSVLTDDRTTLSPFYTSAPAFNGLNHAGEHGNARVALELLVTREAGQAIFVSDDKEASNAFLVSMQCSFPGVHLWTSVDVILYLGAILLKEKKTDVESIRKALRDVYAANARKLGMDDAGKSAIMRSQKNSVESLKHLKKVIDHWRD
jgi:hypothetical protein